MLRIPELFVSGDPRALAAALPADSTATIYIGYGVWTLSRPSPPFPGRLSLKLADTTCIAPVPDTINVKSLSHWRSWVAEDDSTG